MEFVQEGTRDYCEDQEEDDQQHVSMMMMRKETTNFFPASSSCTDPVYSRSVNYQLQTQNMELSLGSRVEEGGGSSGGGEAAIPVEREHMFDKVVTPSDVGKLNRLVIPKQHAEKYFPLDSSTNDKGLLLNFEDRNGKPWRFRYSYWNSSQSYVMTKGWSRFVKEKKLDAGDIVSFQRGVGDAAKDRLFIDWRRRPQTPLPHLHLPTSLRWGARLYSLPQPLMGAPPPPLSLPQYFPPPPHLNYNHNYHNYNNVVHHHHHPYHRQIGYAPQQHLQDHHHYVMNSGPEPVYYLRSSSSSSASGQSSLAMQQQSGGHHVPMVIDSVPLLHGRSTAAAAAGKRLRLFGVNMECEMTSTEEGDDNEPERVVLPSTALLPHVSVSAAAVSPQFSEKGKSSLSFDLDL